MTEEQHPRPRPTAWAGWGFFAGIMMFIGVVAILAGLGVLAGNTTARVAGITLAVISAIVNLAFIAAYPLWGITIDVIVIYALAVHGREVRAL